MDTSRPGPIRHLSIESSSSSPTSPFSLLRRQTSRTSFIHSHAPPTPTSSADLSSPVNKPWPVGMTMGHLRGMEKPGERAAAYAVAVRGLWESDSGLREWQVGVMRRKGEPCIPVKDNSMLMIYPWVEAGTTPRTRKNSTLSTLSVTSPQPSTYPSTLLTPIPASRNVSGASQFPMRADSTSATEITDRSVLVQPIARTPEGLPYPALVERQGGGNVGAGVGGGKGATGGKGIAGVFGLGRRRKNGPNGGSGSISGSVDLGSGISGRRGSSPSSRASMGPASPLSEGIYIGGQTEAASVRTSTLQQVRTSVPSPRGPRARTSIDARRSVELR